MYVHIIVLGMKRVVAVLFLPKLKSSTNQNNASRQTNYHTVNSALIGRWMASAPWINVIRSHLRTLQIPRWKCQIRLILLGRNKSDWKMIAVVKIGFVNERRPQTSVWLGFSSLTLRLGRFTPDWLILSDRSFIRLHVSETPVSNLMSHKDGSKKTHRSSGHS